MATQGLLINKDLQAFHGYTVPGLWIRIQGATKVIELTGKCLLNGNHCRYHSNFLAAPCIDT